MFDLPAMSWNLSEENLTNKDDNAIVTLTQGTTQSRRAFIFQNNIAVMEIAPSPHRLPVADEPAMGAIPKPDGNWF